MVQKVMAVINLGATILCSAVIGCPIWLGRTSSSSASQATSRKSISVDIQPRTLPKRDVSVASLTAIPRVNLLFKGPLRKALLTSQS